MLRGMVRMIKGILGSNAEPYYGSRKAITFDVKGDAHSKPNKLFSRLLFTHTRVAPHRTASEESVRLSLQHSRSTSDAECKRVLVNTLTQDNDSIKFYSQDIHHEQSREVSIDGNTESGIDEPVHGPVEIIEHDSLDTIIVEASTTDKYGKLAEKLAVSDSVPRSTATLIPDVEDVEDVVEDSEQLVPQDELARAQRILASSDITCNDDLESEFCIALTPKTVSTAASILEEAGSERQVKRKKSLGWSDEIVKRITYDTEDEPTALFIRSTPRVEKDGRQGLLSRVVIKEMNGDVYVKGKNDFDIFNCGSGDLRVVNVVISGGVDGCGLIPTEIYSDSGLIKSREHLCMNNADEETKERKNATLQIQFMVRNNTYHKNVGVKCTKDNWATQDDIPASWLKSLSRDFDMFECLIPIHFTSSRWNVEWAAYCFYDYGGGRVEQVWDSRNGLNWSVSVGTVMPIMGNIVAPRRVRNRGFGAIFELNK